MRSKVFLCDIDGTLADHEGLRGHYEYSKVRYDRPVVPIIEIVQRLAGHGGNWYPVFMSGRMDDEEGQCRNDTLWWLNQYADPLGLYIIRPFKLFMRPDKDYRKDYIVKKELYHEHVRPAYNVQFAIDDRLQVCRMWHSIGIPVLRVGDPDSVF